MYSKYFNIINLYTLTRNMYPNLRELQVAEKIIMSLVSSLRFFFRSYV